MALLPEPICTFCTKLAISSTPVVDCGTPSSFLRPPHVLELSHSEAIITRRHGGLAVRDIHLPDDVIIAVFLCFKSDEYFPNNSLLPLPSGQYRWQTSCRSKLSYRIWCFCFWEKKWWVTRCVTLACCFSWVLHNMTMHLTWYSHTILQKSITVCGRGPWVAIYAPLRL